MIRVKLLLNDLKYLGHELQLIELLRGSQKDEEQLRAAINEAVVKSVVIEATLSRPCAHSKLDALLHHHITEREQELLVFLHQLGEVRVHLFPLPCRCLIHLGKFDPLDVELAEVLLFFGGD